MLPNSFYRPATRHSATQAIARCFKEAFQACRLPAIKSLKRLKYFAAAFPSQPFKPPSHSGHSMLLLRDFQACRLPAFKIQKPPKVLRNSFYNCATQATAFCFCYKPATQATQPLRPQHVASKRLSSLPLAGFQNSKATKNSSQQLLKPCHSGHSILLLLKGGQACRTSHSATQATACCL